MPILLTAEQPEIFQASPYTFVFTFISFTILFFLLKKILWGPVTKIIEERTEGIKAEMEKADKKNSEAGKLRKRYRRCIANAEKESLEIIENAKKNAQIRAQEIINNAVREAEAYKVQARKDMAEEHDALFASLQNEITALALFAAGKVMEGSMDTESNKKLVNKILSKGV